MYSNVSSGSRERGEGAIASPGPCKNKPLKRFHVSWAPSTRPLDPLLNVNTPDVILAQWELYKDIDRYKGALVMRDPTFGPISFSFMQFLAKTLLNNRLVHPFLVGTTHVRNPGSATD